MPRQNIFDNQVFFEKYKELRNNEVNANAMFEIPALFSLLPNLYNKRVLDLGCGFGEHCTRFISQGACSVVATDISEKMLEVAKRENSNPKIEYIQMAIEDLNKLNGQFDLVVCSLALHYVEDFQSVCKNVHRLLVKDGYFVFSQEHPLTTSYTDGKRWTKDENDKKIFLNLSNYSVEGERTIEWFVDGVKNYHRTFSTIVNNLADSGFCIEKMIEPTPSNEMLIKYPQFIDLLHKPDFLLIKARAN